MHTLEIQVTRDELTRGIEVSADGQVIGRKRWSLIGTGTIEGTLQRDGTAIQITVRISPPWKCKVSANGRQLDVAKG